MQLPDDPAKPRPFSWRRAPGEIGGACGDLGTFLPHVIGAITLGGLSPGSVLFGFGAFFIASGLFYGLPMAVQPMKAISAVLVTGHVSPAEVAAAGAMMGVTLLLLGLTGTITWIARAIPQSVSAGLQLGLGLSMGVLGAQLMWQTPWLGVSALALLLALMLVPRVPAALIVVALAIAVGLKSGIVPPPDAIAPSWGSTISWIVPSKADLWPAFEKLIVPQMPLTLTNAVIVTALVCRDLYPHATQRATERNLALSSGLANLLLSPLGAMPMCHGAGGVQAQHRFGARTAVAPVLMGSVLLVLAFGFAGGAVALLAAVPMAAVGALLLVAGGDLAISRRLFDSQPSCWPVIAVSAAATLFINPAVALAAGMLAELARKAILQALKRRSPAG